MADKFIGTACLLALFLGLATPLRADDSSASAERTKLAPDRPPFLLSGLIDAPPYPGKSIRTARSRPTPLFRLPPTQTTAHASSISDSPIKENDQHEDDSKPGRDGERVEQRGREPEEEPKKERERDADEEEDEDELDSPEFEEEGISLEACLRDGFELKSKDDQFVLAVRLLNQIDFKVFDPAHQFPAAQTGLYIPRTRFYFEGRLSEPYEYEISFQRSVEGLVDLLDGNVNVRFCGDALQFRVGRFLVPYSYAWYDHLEQYFAAPERALFPLNFGASRSTGGMIWGVLNEGALEYAVAGIDGRLTGLADNGTNADAVGYLNWRPFLSSRNPMLQYLNIGGSGLLGNFTEPSEVLPLRTSIQSSENDESATAASADFLRFEEGVKGIGNRSQAAIHLAWYYRGWTVESEVQVIRSGLSRPDGTGPVNITAAGFHLGVASFVTGEWLTGRTTVDPLRPYDPRCGPRWGRGALEIFSRYSQLNGDSDIFREDLADPDLWTNNAYMVDVGCNWYWNRYLKWTFNWQHTIFGSPVLVNEETEEFSKTNDLFWLRSQFYF